MRSAIVYGKFKYAYLDFMEEVYMCQSRGRKHTVVDDFRMTGADFARYFIIQIRKFTAVSCRKCGHPELCKKGSVCRF